MLDIPILHEDQDIIVISKPPGLVVNKSQTVTEFTLQDWLAQSGKISDATLSSSWQRLIPADFLYEYGTPEEVFAQRGGIVHRLDKETSGVMVLAKNPGALAELLRQFRLRETQKMYTCLVHGKFQIAQDTLTLPLARSSENRTKFSVSAEGRTAETTYKVIAFSPSLKPETITHITHSVDNNAVELKNLRKKLLKTYQGFSLVQCWPKTGRTHQIRVHMSHIKHPIISDQTYLGKKRATLDVLWCPRLFLHATELNFTHPRTKAKMQFRAEWWPDLQKAFSRLVEEG